jgi:hypothetical protein
VRPAALESLPCRRSSVAQPRPVGRGQGHRFLSAEDIVGGRRWFWQIFNWRGSAPDRRPRQTAIAGNLAGGTLCGPWRWRSHRRGISSACAASCSWEPLCCRLRQGSPLRRAERGIHADVAEAQITRMARGYESVGHYRRKRTSIAMMAGNQDGAPIRGTRDRPGSIRNGPRVARTGTHAESFSVSGRLRRLACVSVFARSARPISPRAQRSAAPRETAKDLRHLTQRTTLGCCEPRCNHLCSLERFVHTDSAVHYEPNPARQTLLHALIRWRHRRAPYGLSGRRYPARGWAGVLPLKCASGGGVPFDPSVEASLARHALRGSGPGGRVQSGDERWVAL